jgi:hypothetical protein
VPKPGTSQTHGGGGIATDCVDKSRPEDLALRERMF